MWFLCILCQVNQDLDTIGISLLHHSATVPFSASGGVDRLFPFIYQASQRMSARAIAAWLSKEHNVQLSFSTIARALREPNDRLLAFGQEMLAVAEILEPPMNESGRIPLILRDEQQFRLIEHQNEDLKPATTSSGRYCLPKNQAAASVLRSRWFVLEKPVRDDVLECLAAHIRAQQDGIDAAYQGDPS